MYMIAVTQSTAGFILVQNMCRMKAVPPSWILWWDGISMACREDTGLNNPLQKHKELDLLDVYFEWIILMPFLATSEANSAIFSSLWIKLLSGTCVLLFHCWTARRRQCGILNNWQVGFVQSRSCALCRHYPWQMLKRWHQMFHVTSGLFGVIKVVCSRARFLMLKGGKIFK